MDRLTANLVANCGDALPSLPLDPDHWRAVVQAMGLSDRQATVVELALRDLCDKQIAAVMGLSEATVKDYLKRAGRRLGTRGRMQLAMHVLAVSHEVRGAGCGRSKK